MKKLISIKTIKLISFLTLLLISLAFKQSKEASCDPKTLKERAQKELDPFTYDMSKLTHIAYRSKSTFKEIEAPLFIGEKYRLVFNTEALPKQIIVSVYNRDKESSKRKLLFTTKGAPADKKFFTFDISFARKTFIDYEIPADSTSGGGCIVFMLGYKVGK
ncbi:MAG: hypothetical protein ABI388_12720 [Bacteroidia bacterium]